MTLVSVIVPTYERNEILLSRALPSIVNQRTFADLEVIVVADGMEPESYEELVRGVGTAVFPRMAGRWGVHNIERPNYPDDPGQRWCVLGLHARNYGLDVARGDWIAALDDDDEWTEDHIEVLLRAAIDQGVDFAYGQSDVFWADGHESQYGAWPPGHFQFCDGAQLYRNGMGYRYDWGCIERGLPEDGDLWDRMVAGGVRFTFVPRVVHRYYPNPR